MSPPPTRPIGHVNENPRSQVERRQRAEAPGTLLERLEVERGPVDVDEVEGFRRLLR